MEEQMNRPVSQPVRRKLRARTFLVPLLFIGLHWLVINVVATVYMLVYLLISQFSLSPDILEQFSDVEMLTRLMYEQYPIISVLYALVLIPVYLFYLIMRRRRNSLALLTAPPVSIYLWPSIAVIIGAMGLTNLWFMLLTRLAESSAWLDRMLTSYAEESQAFSTDSGYIWLTLGIVIMAPVAEELLFRGIIQGELRQVMPEWLAVVIQALLFAAFHMQPVQITYVIIPGLLLGFAYAWSGSIYIPIIMHIIFNFLGSIVPSLVADQETASMIVSLSEIAFVLVGALALAYMYMRRRRSAAFPVIDSQEVATYDQV